jgi:hypothetical protein
MCTCVHINSHQHYLSVCIILSPQKSIHIQFLRALHARHMWSKLFHNVRSRAAGRGSQMPLQSAMTDRAAQEIELIDQSKICGGRICAY